MMSVRAVCLVVAAILVSARVPLLWLWLPICFVGMLVVPWLAVIWANDRLSREPHWLGHPPPRPPPANQPAAPSNPPAPPGVRAHRGHPRPPPPGPRESRPPRP